MQFGPNPAAGGPSALTPELAAHTLSSVGTQAAKRALSQKRALKTENTKSLTCMPFSDDIFFRGKKITKTIRIEPLTFLKSSGCGRWLPNGSHQLGHRYSRVLMFFPTWRVACGGGVPACRRIFCLIVIVMREADVPRWCRPRSQRRRRSGGRTEAGPSGITTREASIQPTRL